MSVPFDSEQWSRGRSFKGAKDAGIEPSARLRFSGIALRTIFIALLVVVIAHVSMPQSGTFWTIFDNPGDLLRLLLGMAACAWLAFQLFAMPHDTHAHRTWIRLGILAVPFVLICIIAIW